MRNVLVPVDGSPASLRAVRYLMKRISEGDDIRIHLLNVQPTLPRAVTDFIDAGEIRGYRRDESEKALKKARDMLSKEGIKYESATGVGEVAESAVKYCKSNKCEEIVIGTRGFSPVKNILLGSSTTKLLHLSPVPVTLVK